MTSLGNHSDLGNPSIIGGEVVLGGYLQKKTRVGSWQRRYFETNGAYLTYYKSKKMEKLLAALSLPQVGGIKEVPDEGGETGMFSLELNSRVYILKGKNSEEAKLWVQTLTRLRDQGLSRDSSISLRQASTSSYGKPSISVLHITGSGKNSQDVNSSTDSEFAGKSDWEKSFLKRRSK